MKKKTPSVTVEMAAKIKLLLKTGEKQHRIAALFDINQGRISEINTGKKFSNVDPRQYDLDV